jgi:hypothetical protein
MFLGTLHVPPLSQHCDNVLSVGWLIYLQTQREKDALALEVSQKVLAVIADTLLGVAGDVVPVLRHTRVVPQVSVLLTGCTTKCISHTFSMA